MRTLADATEPYPIVSLDIFDTALLRAVLQPADIFLIAGQQCADLLSRYRLSPDQFRSLRLEADRRSRRVSGGRHEATLKDIYQSLAQIAQISEGDCARLMQAEIDAEMAYIRPNPEVRGLYCHCLDRRQKVVFVSDMYLPPDVIRALLTKGGYDEQTPLFVSCEIGVTKREGSLYTHVLSALQIDASQMIHIGDSERADVSSARQNGITAILYRKATAQAHEQLPHLPQMESAIGGSLMGALIANRRYASQSVAPLSPENYWEHFGYAYAGPLYYGFATWLAERVRRDGIQQIHFLAREGHTLQRVYERVAARLGQDIPHNYLYASRRLYTFSLIDRLDDKAIRTLLGKRLPVSVGTFLSSNWLEPAKYHDQLRRFGFHNLSDRLDSPEAYDRLKHFLLSISDDVLRSTAQERDSLLDYLRRCGFGERQKIAVVDVGWQGSMQQLLNRLSKTYGLEAQISGYYLGAFGEQASYQNDKFGYLIENGKPKREASIIWEGIYLFEFLHAAPHPSIVGLRRAGDEIQPIYMTGPESEENNRALEVIQTAALCFVDHMLEEHGVVSVPSRMPLEIYKRLLFKPTALEAQLIGDLVHIESMFGLYEVRHIARPSIETHNPLKLPQLFSDYLEAHWKTGYLKRSRLNPVYKFGLASTRNAKRWMRKIRQR